MDSFTVFISTFILIFIGELGDKTQIAAGTGTLANRGNVKIVFLSSCLALTCVAGITVFAAGLIPSSYIPIIKKTGGVLLVLYGAYLFRQSHTDETHEGSAEGTNSWKLFFAHFAVVFMAELGDKTQLATLASAVAHQTQLLLIFSASASALILVTTITIWGVTRIPSSWIVRTQKVGAALMIGYGIYMIL